VPSLAKLNSCWQPLQNPNAKDEKLSTYHPNQFMPETPILSANIILSSLPHAPSQK
jgi:hypothetical protein